jgi:hypothetical protein
MKFELNEVEKKTLNSIYDAIGVIYSGENENKRKITYCFTPTGIGVHIKVIIKGEDQYGFEYKIEKDITDYDSW